MPINAIVSFTFYRLVAWFNERHATSLALQSKNQSWASKPTKHLDKAKERATTHEVQCFDHTTKKYEITERCGTTFDGEVRPSRAYIVVLSNFSCKCGRPRQYHFPCSHYIAAAQHRNITYESKIPREFSVHSLVLTWSARYKPYLDKGQWPEYTGLRYIVDPVHVGTNVEPGRERGTRWSWIRCPVERGEGEQAPFLLTPSRINVVNVVDLGTTHIHAIGRLVRCILHSTIVIVK
jgi:hypothetical protein